MTANAFAITHDQPGILTTEMDVRAASGLSLGRCLLYCFWVLGGQLKSGPITPSFSVSWVSGMLRSSRHLGPGYPASPQVLQGPGDERGVPWWDYFFARCFAGLSVKPTSPVPCLRFWSKIYLCKLQTHTKKEINTGCSKGGLSG